MAKLIGTECCTCASSDSYNDITTKEIRAHVGANQLERVAGVDCTDLHASSGAELPYRLSTNTDDERGTFAPACCDSSTFYACVGIPKYVGPANT